MVEADRGSLVIVLLGRLREALPGPRAGWYPNQER